MSIVQMGGVSVPIIVIVRCVTLRKTNDNQFYIFKRAVWMDNWLNNRIDNNVKKI